MEPSQRQRIEEQIRKLSESHEYQRAAELALQSYGPDIRRLMMVSLKNEDRVADAFGTFSESLVKSLPKFRWNSSLRTWAYSIARYTCAKCIRSRSHQEQLATESTLDRQPQPERSVTQPWLRSDIKSRFRSLQARLSPHEQMILLLRIERGLPWNEVARAMADRDLQADELAQRAVVLRQQFQRLKAHLRELAIEDSLLQPAMD